MAGAIFDADEIIAMVAALVEVSDDAPRRGALPQARIGSLAPACAQGRPRCETDRDAGRAWGFASMMDLVIEVANEPGALAKVAAAISDAGVNISAVACTRPGDRAELHILVPHAEAAKHALAISGLAVTREREVAVVAVDDVPGVLADLARKVADAGINLDLVYVATRNRVVFGAPDLPALKAVLGQ
jgi:hypothetical protein